MRTLRALLVVLLIAAFALFGASGVIYSQQYGAPRCEACGMNITADMLAHIVIKDVTGNRHYACCQGCMLRLLDPKKGYEQLSIETFCDYYGPDYKIMIDVKDHGNETIVTPNSAVILLGTKVVQSCANNRIAYNQTAAEKLIEQGYGDYTMTFQRNPLPNGTPVLKIDEVAVMMAQKGISYVAPLPWTPALLAVIGVVMIAASFVGYKKLKA